MHPYGPKQAGVVECGYYVMQFMCNIILSKSTSIINVVSITILKQSSCHLFRMKLNNFKTIIMSFISIETNLKSLYCLQMKGLPRTYTQSGIKV